MSPFKPTHVSHKRVEAYPIARGYFRENGSGSVTLKDGRSIEVPAGFIRTGRFPCEGDMLVRYEPTRDEPEGYLSHSPLSVFNAGYSSLADRRSSLTLGAAIEALMRGERVCRAGWNGKGMWLSLSGPLRGMEIPADKFWSAITMKTATGEILMGWLASQTDMLADDWMVVPAA